MVQAGGWGLARRGKVARECGKKTESRCKVEVQRTTSQCPSPRSFLKINGEGKSVLDSNRRSYGLSGGRRSRMSPEDMSTC